MQGGVRDSVVPFCLEHVNHKKPPDATILCLTHLIVIGLEENGLGFRSHQKGQPFCENLGVEKNHVIREDEIRKKAGKVGRCDPKTEFHFNLKGGKIKQKTNNEEKVKKLDKITKTVALFFFMVQFILAYWNGEHRSIVSVTSLDHGVG